MNKIFPHVSEHNSHVYIADYTESTKSAKGVEISDAKFPDIKCCTFKNDRRVACWGINFEKNKRIFKIGRGKVDQCECMLVSKDAKKKGWLCLVELKYCKEKNVDTNAYDAYGQLKATFDHLVSKDIISLANHRVYFNISIPDHSNKEPFLNFIFSQDDILEIKSREKIHVLGYNTIEILNEGYLNFRSS
jgi:hypothetical protein